MASAAVNRITHRIGTDGVYTYTVRDDDGATVNLSTGTLALSLRAYPGCTTETASESTLALSGSAAGVLTITIQAADLATVTPGNYVALITRTLSGVVTSYPVGGYLVFELLPADE